MRLLRPSPGRWEFATRLALICALTTLATELYRTPDPALTVYLVFFLNKPDRATSIVTDLVLLVLITIIIAFIILVSRAVLDSPFWRVVAIAVCSFGLLFLTSASKLKPVGAIIALIVGYGLDELGLVPGGEIGTRALLYAWLFVATPAAISIIVNFLIAPAPRRMAERALARRLRDCAEALREPGGESAAALAESLREGLGEIPAWLRLAGVERTSSPVDIAALSHAADSTIAIQLLTDLMLREPMAAPAAPARERIAGLLGDMAEILQRGGYPQDIVLEPLEGEGDLPELGQSVLADLRQTLAAFAEPPAEPAAKTPAEAPSGFFLPDAFTNPEHQQFALKTTVAALFCYALYTQLDWPGIHTCFITCYIVGLTTTAETVEKLTLRIIGCLIGAAIGTLALVFVTPHLAAIGGLMAVIFLAALASAWVAVGDERIAYAGFQMAFAFFLCVLQGSTPGFDLATARDRVIGILIGNVVTYLVFVLVWPISVAGRIDPGLEALVRKLGAIASAAGSDARRVLAAESLAAVTGVKRDIGLASLEPTSIRPDNDWLEHRRGLARHVGALIGPLLLFAEARPGLAGGLAPRLGSLSDAIAEPGFEPAPPASAARPPPSTLKGLIDERLSGLEQAVKAGRDFPEGTNHALA